VGEAFDREKGLERQIRAFHWIRLLAELPARFAGSPSEREAADRIESWLRDLGVEDVRRQVVVSRPAAGLVLALHLGIAGFACVVGGAFGASLALLAAFSIRGELRRGRSLLSRVLPNPESLNVVGRAGARHPGQRVVLSAHIDSAQAGWLFTPAVADFFARRAEKAAARGAQTPGPNALPEAAVLAAAGLLLAHALGAEGFLIGAARTLLALALAAGCAVTLQWGFAQASPGANDNASAVAAMLTCAEQLLSQLPDDVELWIVGTGAEEVGCRGMHEFVSAHADWPRDATCFVNFETVGGGSLHWVRSEGTLAKSGYPPTLVELARRVAESGVFGAVTPVDLLAGTDGHVAAEHGYPTLSLISLEAGGVPRNYHRIEDVPEAVDLPTVIRAADFGAAVARAALRGEAGPIAIL
jgi:acetylornithine deacetylase/succinyl-diaminopimelate desuccinylase-like protein